MCVSFWPTNFTRTITGTWEVLIDGRVNHVLWYQNNVGGGTRQSLTLADQLTFEIIVGLAINGEPWLEPYADQMQAKNIAPFTVEEEVEHRKAGGKRRSLNDIHQSYAIPDLPEGEGNCLIIPLLGSWESIRLLNTTDLPNFLQDVSDSLDIPKDATNRLKSSVGSSGGDGGGIVFLQFSIYDIVIAENASSLQSALAQINPLKRPTVNEGVFSTLEQWYQCPVAVCCFNNAESGTAKPLAFAFEPLYPEKLVVYSLDAHDGKPPNPSAEVIVDHTIFVGSYLSPPSMCATIKYTDTIPEHMQPYMLKNIMGTHIRDEWLENGDIVFATDEVRAGRFDGLRSLPPFGPASVPRLGHRVTRSYGYIQAGTV